MNIAICLPTRGLVFTEVLDAIEAERQYFTDPFRIFFSTDKVIPEGHNNTVIQALEWGADYLWIIEEDTVPPINALKSLLNANADVACIDYGVSGYSTITKDKKTSEILWCALGCTLIKREVFSALEYPYFKADKALLINNWPEVTWINAGWQAYGNLDIWFFMKAREKGFVIKQAKGEAKHLQLDQLGQKEINNGLHQISQKPLISKYQTL